MSRLHPQNASRLLSRRLLCPMFRYVACKYELRSILLSIALLPLLIRAWLSWGAGRASGDDSVIFVTIGDFGTGSDEQKAVANQMASTVAQTRASFVVTLGDNVYPAGVKGLDDQQFRTLFEDIYTHEALQIPWYITLGDHDHRGSVQAQVEYSKLSEKWNMPSPYYLLHFPFKNGGSGVDIVVTDSVRLEGAIASPGIDQRRFLKDYSSDEAGKEAGEKHLEWLETTLESSTADWLIVVGHRPVISSCKRSRYPAEKTFSTVMKKLLVKHKVDVYMSGHDHIGQHLEEDGVIFLGNGVGGFGTHGSQPNENTIWANDHYFGFTLQKITKSKMEFSFIDTEGRVLHTVSKSKVSSKDKTL